ncbi:MAG: hypothetical protein M3O35_18350 [Acidobacteriota bacterium]|nr:hypothetical protein [Acidobacteriota bacterium]
MTDNWKVVLLLALAPPLLGFGVWLLFRLRRDPNERERRRRDYINLRGRLGDGLITEADHDMLYYSYSIRGVVYMASQDIAPLIDRIGIPPERLIGPVTLKYDVNNPANSIVICENWSGLRGS